MDARRLAADMHVQFTKSAEAANRAVMAGTDDAAAAAAKEAEQAAEIAQRDIEQLEPILQSLTYADETTHLSAFKMLFAEFRTLDREILPLATENTNLKAQRLSFGAARDAVAEFRTALDAATNTAPANSAARVEALAAQNAVLGIVALHAPHIAEAEDAAMSRMESDMAASDTAARAALAALARLLPASAAGSLTSATSALDRFLKTNAEIVSLSRRNSNVRSLALSLGRKRMVTAICDDHLRALEESLAKHRFTATR
jgi:hypothetical protein